MRPDGEVAANNAMDQLVDRLLVVAAGRGPLEFRRSHLAGRTRILAVLDRVAEMLRWGESAPDGIARGLAVVESYNSCVAQVVEARILDGRIDVEQVHAAIDCGRAINPGQVETQIQGAVIDALGAALRQKGSGPG